MTCNMIKRTKLALAVALSAATVTSAVAQTPSASAQGAAQTQPAPPARGPSFEVALDAARVALDACKAKGFNTGVSVVDSAGILKVLLSADGTSARGVQSSTNKAVTALTFKAPTSQLGEQSKVDKALADKIAANPNFNNRAGGVLLKVGEEVIGAIGVGGARGSENDEACALAGIQQVQSRLK